MNTPQTATPDTRVLQPPIETPANTASTIPASTSSHAGTPSHTSMSGGNPMVEQLKAQMADIVEPTAVGWWPLAWGWWVLAALVFALTVGLIVWLVTNYRRNLYRRQALKLLAQQEFTNQHQQAQFLMRLSKQVALKAYPNARNTIARAFGDEWLNWLNGTTAKPLFDTQHAQQWQATLYQRSEQSPTTELSKTLQCWIRKHQRNAKVANATLEVGQHV